MTIEVHAPSTPVLVASLVLAVIALLAYFLTEGTPVPFWSAIMAYVVMALGSMVKT